MIIADIESRLKNLLLERLGERVTADEIRSETPLLKKKPSELVRAANVWFSVEAGETLLPQAVEYVGDQHFLYASDVPHWDNEFPDSLNHLRDHPGLSREVKENILYHNAKRLFALEAKTTA